METVKLGTVYRSTDEEHLLFQKRIRTSQPKKEIIQEYFGERHWCKYEHSLEECVAYGMKISEDTNKTFT